MSCKPKRLITSLVRTLNCGCTLHSIVMLSIWQSRLVQKPGRLRDALNILIYDGYRVEWWPSITLGEWKNTFTVPFFSLQTKRHAVNIFKSKKIPQLVYAVANTQILMNCVCIKSITKQWYYIWITKIMFIR